MVFQVKDYENTHSSILDAQRRLLATYRGNYGPNPLLEIGDHMLAAPGKMMRGVLMLEACRVIGGHPEQILSAAACVEYGHSASLIHDDMIDHDGLRRGQSTVWKAYGDDAAILSGDLFVFAAIHSLSQCRHTIPGERVARAFEVLSLACLELCLGQASEAQLSGNCSVCSQQYLDMIHQKTAGLFQASVEMGAVLGGGSKEQISVLRKYGEYLGMAFQIVDDLLPYMGEESTLGKPTKSDIKNRRMTLPIIYALEDGNKVEREILYTIFERGCQTDKIDEAKNTVTTIIQRTGALERVIQTARDYQQNALRQLTHLPEDSDYTTLAYIAEFVTKRSM